MLPLAGQHHGFDRVRQRGKERLDARHGRIVDGVALLRAGQEQNGDLAPALGLERRRQFDVETARGFAHRDPRSSRVLRSVTFLQKAVKRHTTS
jgi:hypothetical protein